MQEDSFVLSHKLERVLAYMVAAVILVSLASFVAVLIAYGQDFTSEQFATGIWPMITIMPLIGLPIGFILIITLLVVSAVRRGRAAKDAGH